jgi:flagellar M-ring protein FliF
VAEQAEAIKTIEGKAAPKGASLPVQQMAENLRHRVMAMHAGRRNWLLASIVFLVGAVTAMVWYAGRPDWRVLFSGMEARDSQQVAQELSAAGLTYRMSADGSSVEVPADTIDKARIEVAAKGMPQSGRMGFELFDKPNWVGSEFDERVNYQRALEGELEHTIQTLGVVRSARVHLVLPQPSLFSAQEKVAKASVVLKLKRSNVDAAEADSIRSLVAGAVDNLSPADVVLVDSDGRVNLKPQSASMEAGDVEQALEAKLVSLLEPLAGRDNVRATVRVSYDQSSEEKTDEVYDPTQVAATNMQRSEQSSTAPTKASGVPGTASNTPAGAANGAVQGSPAATPTTPPLLQKDAPVYPQGSAQGQTVKQESGTYAVSKHTTHLEMGPGRVGRITAAVLVNDKLATEGTGKSLKAVWKPRSPDEIRRLEELAQAAVGYDPKRGDQVVIQNMSFSSNAPEAPAPILDRVSDGAKGFLRTQPNLIKTLVLGLCGILLVMFVLKPVAQQAIETMKEPVMLADGSGPHHEADAMQTHHLDMVDHEEALGSGGMDEMGEEHAMAPQRQMSAPVHHAPVPIQRRGKTSAQAIFDSVAEHIREDSMQSTRVLQSWIAPGEKAEG